MPKKTLEKIPTPAGQLTAEQIANYNRDGPGHTNRQPRRPVRTVGAERKVRCGLTVMLPKSLHTAFKAGCAANNVKMLDELQDMIEKRIPKLQELAGNQPS